MVTKIKKSMFPFEKSGGNARCGFMKTGVHLSLSVDCDSAASPLS